MAKNPFKKQGMVDSLIAVGTGGAANAVIDMAVESFNGDREDPISETTINIAKLVGGVVIGSMVGGNKIVRAAVDGIATVGASNLVSGLINGELLSSDNNSGGGSDTGGDNSTSGFKRDVMGAVRPGYSRLARQIRMKNRVSGTNGIVG